MNDATRTAADWREAVPARVELTPDADSEQGSVDVSVVVPTYRDDVDDLRASLAALERSLEATGRSWEIIVVVDGDRQTYSGIVESGSDRIRVHGYAANRGKGFALRYGMTKTRGRLVTFIDSDGEIDPQDIGRMANLLELYRADVVVGSKRHPLSEVCYPFARRAQSWCYHMLTRLLFRLKVRDTQTGLKLMRREVALRVLDVALVKRFAFDLELLALAMHFGFGRIIEAPVSIHYRFRSTTNLRAALAVLRDTLAIFYRLYIRRWYDRAPARGLHRLMADLPPILEGRALLSFAGEPAPLGMD